MDVSTFLKTLQRRWWALPLAALVGLLIVLAVRGETTTEYRSQATLLVRAPSAVSGTGGFSDPDRYVQGQLTVLESQGLVNTVASRVGDTVGAEVRPGEIRQSTTITQIPDTDIVEIVVLAATAQRAQTIASTYTAAYLDLQREAATTTQQPELDRLNTRLAEILNELEDVNTALEVVVAPYVNSDGVPIPDTRLLDPANSGRSDLLLAEYNRVDAAKNDLELSARLQVNTDIVQQATLPGSPVTSKASVPVAVGVIAGALFGLFLIMVFAQFSPYALDEIAIGNAVQGTVTGRLGRRRELRSSPLTAFQQLSVSRGRALDSLAVRAEARQGSERVLSILVVGTHRGAGSTTVALALAGRLGQSHRQVMLVDGDFRDPWITQWVADSLAASPTSYDDEIDGLEVVDDAASSSVAADDESEFREIAIGDGSVRVLQYSRAERSAQPSAVMDLVDAASQRSAVVIIDGGPLLESARAVQLARQVQVVVLVSSERAQRIDELESIRLEIGATKSPILVVSNNSAGAGQSRRDRRKAKRVRSS